MINYLPLFLLEPRCCRVLYFTFVCIIQHHALHLASIAAVSYCSQRNNLQSRLLRVREKNDVIAGPDRDANVLGTFPLLKVLQSNPGHRLLLLPLCFLVFMPSCCFLSSESLFHVHPLGHLHTSSQVIWQTESLVVFRWLSL